MQDSADGLVMVKGDGITEMFVYRAVLVSVIKYKNMRLNREAHTVLIKKESISSLNSKVLCTRTHISMVWSLVALGIR